MSRSNDAGHFFQTSDALATSERKTEKAKNKHGNPIKLSSKILAASQSCRPRAIFVAEAAGDVKLVDLEVCKDTGSTEQHVRTCANTSSQSHKITRIFSQGNAPLTCLAVQNETSVFTGSWDKNIYCINPSNPQQPARKLQGHTDFVKCLVYTVIAGTPILISGSADASIIIWDISTQNFGKILHKLKGHAKALQDLAIDEFESPNDRSHVIVFSSSSTAEIRRWHISLSRAYEIQESIDKSILAHETSVYTITFDSSGDLWTASADNTARHLVRSRSWAFDTTLPHPDFVRSVLPIDDLGLVVTACRDEEVRVWDMASGELVCTYSGHFEEVCDLLVAADGTAVVSLSLDGTVRQWSLKRGDIIKYQEERAREESGERQVDDDGKKLSILTAEEEAELAELMDDHDG